MTTTSKIQPHKWLSSNQVKDTFQLGARIGRHLTADSVILLQGPIGSGKTTFTKGLAYGLGWKQSVSDVLSPTFVLVHEYPTRIPIYHIDLYRLDNIGFEDQALIEECLARGGITVIEWAERASNIAPRSHLHVTFEHIQGDRRRIRFTPKGAFVW